MFFLSGIKRKFTEQLNSRFHFNTLEVDSSAVLSAALDPRFWKLSFLSESQQAKLLDVLVQLASTDNSADSSSIDAGKTMEPPMKKRISVLDHLLSDDKQDEDASTLDEVKSYLQEHPIKCKEDPLCWWKMNGSRFSHLEPLARRYLAIPATSTPSERVFSVAGIVVDNDILPLHQK